MNYGTNVRLISFVSGFVGKNQCVFYGMFLAWNTISLETNADHLVIHHHKVN